MTEVSFHFNAAEPLGYTCRLLRKAWRSGSRVAVTGPAATLGELDRQLWTFDPHEFLPHARLAAGSAPGPLHRRTPLWLVDDAGDAALASGAFGVLVNLGAEPVPEADRFARLIEVVSTEPGERDAARRRWKHYAAGGHAVTGHDVGAA